MGLFHWGPSADALRSTMSTIDPFRTFRSVIFNEAHIHTPAGITAFRSVSMEA